MDEKNKKSGSSVGAAAVILGLVVAYFSLGTFFSGGNGATETIEDVPPFLVLTQEVRPESRAGLIQFSGRTRAGQRVTVRAEAAGQVSALPVREGQRVAKGDLLCRLDVNGRDSALSEARANLAKARNDFAATERLAEEGFAAQTALQGARAQLDAALARAEAAELQLANTAIRAPFGGTVSDVPVEAGDVLNVGSPCAVIADLGAIEVRGGVPQQSAGALSVGDQARVEIAGSTYDATVTYVSEVASQDTRTFRVDLAIEASGIAEGLEAAAEVFGAEDLTVRLPRSALVYHDDGRLGVRTVSPTGDTLSVAETSYPLGTVAFETVAIVGEDEGAVILEGVRNASRVITRGQEFVTEGTTVRYQSADGVAR